MDDEPVPQGTAHAPVEIDWVTGLEFEAGRPGARKVHIDADANSAPGPFDLLLGALAACAASDVVTILQKQRATLRSLHVNIEAKRVTATPRRLASVTLHFIIRAQGWTPEKAQRAIELAVTKYCSVGSSLRPDAPITWTVELGE
ncbi:MAG TPA: OsmC family protein [Steroidobacteraceae bacterium]|nr:OsmC family protein [Steroidobacteraceae bacterium]